MLVCLNLEPSVKLHLVNKNHQGTNNSLVSARQSNTCTTDFVEEMAILIAGNCCLLSQMQLCLSGK